MTKTKPVGLAHLNKEVKKLSEVKKYYLDVEQGDFITYHEKFDKEKVNEILMELSEAVVVFKKEGLDYLINDEQIKEFTLYLIVKKFTSLGASLKGKDVYVDMETMAKLRKVGWMELFITDMFDEVEVMSVIDKLHEVAKFISQNQKELSEKIKMVESKIENKELKEKLLTELSK